MYFEIIAYNKSRWEKPPPLHCLVAVYILLERLQRALERKAWRGLWASKACIVKFSEAPAAAFMFKIRIMLKFTSLQHKGPKKQ